ncbi:hypothetical protein ABHI18_008698 [Aspergillus niger]
MTYEICEQLVTKVVNLRVPIRGRSNDSAAEPTEEALKSMADHLADYGTRLVDDVELLCKRLLH